jgi:GDPmannose 4,6-dehydratase
MKLSNKIRCVVLGANGQDGSYVIEQLLARGYEVWGVGRQKSSYWINNSSSFNYQMIDLCKTIELVSFLRQINPHKIFHLAAVHGSAGFSYEDHWEEVSLVNTILPHAILEYLRKYNPNGFFIYTSSSKAFGSTTPSIISEKSRRISSCIYSISKNTATDLIIFYRKKYGIKASVIWTFNHESPRRSVTYFIPKIVNILANSIDDESHNATIQTSKFWCDWGDAEEYMGIIINVAENAIGKDFILATGKTLWAESFIKKLFLNYKKEYKNHVIESNNLPNIRPRRWRANINSLYSAINYVPQKTIYNICDDIMRVNYHEQWLKTRIE